MFKPEFVFPDGMNAEEGTVMASLAELFNDLSAAVEKISGNYHEDYLFKRYLQDKWNEILGSSEPNGEQSPPAAAATV